MKALLIYQLQQPLDKSNFNNSAGEDNQVYVESYDIGRNGNPINAHPLSPQEMIALSEMFQNTQERKNNYLKSRGILPSKVLYVNQQANGFAVWHTPPKDVDLYFVEGLKIPNGKAKIPAMVWKATKDSLNVYAIKGRSKPTEKTTLYHAPYFNIYENGNVCMGTVNIQIDRNTTLDDFIAHWEAHFFNSYFSHTIGSHKGSHADMVKLWRGQVGTGRPFPTEVLVPSNHTIKRLIQ